MYNIVRHYYRAYPNKRIVQRGLTEAEAKAHCASIEASSDTCTNPALRRATRRMGKWFEGYARA